MIILFNIIIVVIVIFILYDFYYGYIIALCSMILLPYIIRLELGGFSYSVWDITIGALILSFLIHYKKIDKRIPRWLKNYLVFDVVTSFILVFVSDVVPINVQLASLAKTKFITQIPLFLFTYMAMKKNKPEKMLRYLMITFIVAGCYGILSYIIKMNPYILIISNLYAEEDLAGIGLVEEQRGILTSRTMGTTLHPLAWGIYWILALSFVTLYKRISGNLLYYLFILIGVVNVFLCGSRSALIGLGVAILFVLFFYGKRKAFKWIVVMFLLSFVTLEIVDDKNINRYVEAVVYFWNEEKADAANIAGSGTEMRKEQLEESIRISLESSIGGLGYGYVSYSAKYGQANSTMLGYESVIFKTLVEQGVGGLFALIWLFYLLAQRILMNRVIEKKRILLVWGFYSSYLITIIFTGNQGISNALFMILLLSYFSIEESKKNINYTNTKKS